LFEPPPEIELALQLLRANREGGEPAAWRCFEQHTDLRPDSLLVARLRPDLGHPGKVILPPHLGRFLDEHRQRLRRKREAAILLEKAQSVHRSLRLPPGHRVAQALRTSGEAPTARLRDELPGALALAEGEGYAGANLVRRAEEIAYLDNRPLAQTRKRAVDKHGNLREKITSLDVLAEVFDDPTALDAYRGAEDALLLEHLITQARLTARECEVLDLYRRGFEPEAIAGHLGVASGTVYVLLASVRAKLRAVA
jgi:DNA-binding CsgD family transcriptional regulator